MHAFTSDLIVVLHSYDSQDSLIYRQTRFQAWIQPEKYFKGAYESRR